MKKKLLALLLATSLVGCFAVGCGSTSDDESSTESGDSAAAETTSESDAGTVSDSDIDYSSLKVGIVMKSSDEFQNAVVDGAIDACTELGIPEANINAVASTSESDAYQQVTAIEDMIADGVDILLNSCQEENALQSVLQTAADAGTKVVMVDTDCDSFEDKVTFVGTDNESAAYEGATEFASRLEEGSNVVILRGKLGDVNHEDRTNGLTEALEDAGMNVLDVQDANCETDKAANVMENWLTQYPDEIDAVMVTSDSMAVGAAQAIKNAGVEGIKICGFDGFQSAIELVETGEIEMIIAQQPYQMGYDGIYYAIGSLEGETYDSYTSMGIVIIDSENYQDYLE